MTSDTVMAGDAAEDAPQFVQANSSSGLEYLLHPVRTITSQNARSWRPECYQPL